MYNGARLVKGKRVTGFTNGEEEAVHLMKVVPFLVEDELKRIGGLYEKAKDWESHAVVDGRRYRTESCLVDRGGPIAYEAARAESYVTFQSKGDRIQSSFRSPIG